MAAETSQRFTIGLLADAPELVPAVGEMRWREWGHEPEREHLSWWVDTTSREAGRSDLPVTFVATDERGEAVGAVGLGQFDIEERRDRSPWLLGMIVAPDRRGLGIGRSLVTSLEKWAAERGTSEIWVATGGKAVDFYRNCGWTSTETIVRDSGEAMNVLVRRLGVRGPASVEHRESLEATSELLVDEAAMDKLRRAEVDIATGDVTTAAEMAELMERRQHEES